MNANLSLTPTGTPSTIRVVLSQPQGGPRVDTSVEVEREQTHQAAQGLDDDGVQLFASKAQKGLLYPTQK